MVGDAGGCEKTVGVKYWSTASPRYYALTGKRKTFVCEGQAFECPVVGLAQASEKGS